MEPSSKARRNDTSAKPKAIRYGTFLGAVRGKQRVVSYNEVFLLEHESPRATRLRLIDIHRLVTPYVSVRFMEQTRAVIPLALFLAGFQILIFSANIRGAEMIALGLLAVMAGLMCFMEGVKHGLMPFAENIGYRLPGSSGMPMVLTVAFTLGAAATFAEPAIGALQAVQQSLGQSAPAYLRLMLDDYVLLLISSVALSVGAAVALGNLRFSLGVKLKPLILVILVPCMTLTVIVGTNPQLAPILGLAWDCGAITTGPVTVPLVLAIGIGIAAAAGRSDNPLSGFGIVTLASLFPAMAVMLAALWLQDKVPVPPAFVAVAHETATRWWEMTPFQDILLALRAILPLVLLLMLVQRFILREKIKQRESILYGIVIAVVGMILFNIGLASGLVPLGDQAGAAAPFAFAKAIPGGTKPLYPYIIGVTLTLAFAFCLGFGATIAEPALNAMGITVENLTDGAFTRTLLIRTVATGVGIGAAVGVSKVIFDLPMMWLLLGGYTLAFLLTVFSNEDYVNLAWDSAGVTTGPVTVPLTMALGLGLATAVGANDGFGILAMASIGPILSVLAVGLWVRWTNLHVESTGRNKT